MSFYKIIFFGLILLTLVLVMPPVFADTWYVGKGLKQGDFFRYNVCWYDWHNCTPLEIDFWVKNETNDGNCWNLVFVAMDGSNIQKGIVTIGKITPDPTSFDPNIEDYASVYRSTISWLDVFAKKDSPKSFNVPVWGGAGVDVGPMGQEKVTVKAGSFDAWIIGWHEGTYDKIWIDPSLPFPVKAIVYVNVPSGNLPLDYALELLETGNSKTVPSWNMSKTSSLFNYSHSIEVKRPDLTQLASENYLLGQQIEHKIQNEQIMIVLPPLLVGIGIGATAFFVIFHKTRIKQ